MTSFWTCIDPMASQNPDQYTEGEQFPACELFQTEWNETVATKKGYIQPFETPYSNRIEGTDGTMCGEPVQSNKIQLFSYDIYRSVYLGYQKEVDWYGVNLRRYIIQHKDVLNGNENPTNEQYYSFGPSGLLNVTKAAAGAPVFVSFPNFYQGADSLLAAVTGLVPNAEIHETTFDIEPQTGLIARAEKNLQLNYQIGSAYFPRFESDEKTFLNKCLLSNLGKNMCIALYVYLMENTKYAKLSQCLNTPVDWNIRGDQIFFPYGWVSEQLVLTESAASDIKNSIYYTEQAAANLRFWCIIVAAMLLLVLATIEVEEYLKKYEILKKNNKRTISVNLNRTSFSGWATEPLLDDVDKTSIIFGSPINVNLPPVDSGHSF